MNLRLSTENVHATAVAQDGRAVLICGPSGSGKSDLALRLIDRGFTLVSDDRTLVRGEDERLIASAPPAIRGKIEVRGLGIVDVPAIDDVPVALAAELDVDIPRLPDDSRERLFLGIAIPLIAVDAMTASAAAKVALALDHAADQCANLRFGILAPDLRQPVEIEAIEQFLVDTPFQILVARIACIDRCYRRIHQLCSS